MRHNSILRSVLFAAQGSTGFLHAQTSPDHHITTFDVPGAGTGPGQGTMVTGITAAGAITGWYIDANNVNHAFLRSADGTISTFDVPGAGTGAGQGTLALGMNEAGDIVGYYLLRTTQLTHM